MKWIFGKGFIEFLRRFSIIRSNDVNIFKSFLTNDCGNILDIGSSDAYWSEILLENNKNFAIHVDIDFKALKIAKERVRFVVCADAKLLPFKENVFQQIFSISVLQLLNIEDVKRCLVEVKKTLASKGKFYFCVDCFDGNKRYEKLRVKHTRRENVKTYFRMFPTQNILQKTGFKINEIFCVFPGAWWVLISVLDSIQHITILFYPLFSLLVKIGYKKKSNDGHKLFVSAEKL